MLLLAALAAASQPPPTQAQARVRIISAVRASRSDWDKAVAAQRREVTIREKEGRLLKVRLVEVE